MSESFVWVVLGEAVQPYKFNKLGRSHCLDIAILVLENGQTHDGKQSCHRHRGYCKLVKETETPATTFETYLQKCRTIKQENWVTISKLKDAFFSSNQ